MYLARRWQIGHRNGYNRGTIFQKETKIMLGNFVYCNPTKLYFEEEDLDNLNTGFPKYGKI